MKKIISLTLLTAMAFSVYAQDTYTNVQFNGEDLSGTARYVSMGGAMEALGADITTMGTNPAGIGLFRRSTVSLTGGLNIGNTNTTTNDRAHQVTPSFNQAGFVIALKSGSNSYFNFGFNYRLSKNFNQLFDVTNSLDNSSQMKNSYDKYQDEYMDVGWRSESVIDNLYNEGLMKDGPLNYELFREADKFRYQEMRSGYISDFDFNFSGNIDNWLYLGFTFGIRDIHYKSNTLYEEHLPGATDVPEATIAVDDETRITGKGYNVKFGAIVRPWYDSPFRIGAYIHTPTWYQNLKKEWNTYLDSELMHESHYDNSYLPFALTTPWKFGISLGHTVANSLALGVTYEYSKYNSMNNRIIDGNDYTYYGSYTRTSSDEVMNRNTRSALAGLHTLKVGMEYKLVPELAIRVGYNYLSPMYNKSGVRDNRIKSQGVWASTTTAYTNWESTHRITCGLGFTIKNFNVDLAYQYNTSNGTFYPFQTVTYNPADYPDNPDIVKDNNIGTPTKIKDERHMISATLTYKF